MTHSTWKQHLSGRIAPDWEKEIDQFQSQIALRKAGKIEERVFAETRLRRGVYGQRYDNGHRHDGIATQQLPFPSDALTKGPETMWDAPGMQRIKIPFGGLNAAQMRVLAELAEEYSDGICHVTTRQDIQLHYVHIEDAPDIMRRLAAAGITTREACGNTIRNVTACPLAGVCRDEVFDVTPYAKAMAFFMLGHPDAQDFGRKFKIAFSGCRANACALVSMHDFGGIAVEKIVDGKKKRGFELYVGGGLGTVPIQAKLFAEFVPEDELLPLAQAISRVFARLGEKKNRNKARLKFLVQKLGIDEFKHLVTDELKSMPKDDFWKKYFSEIPRYEEKVAYTGLTINGKVRPAGYDEWAATNVYQQRQGGYAVATVTLPLGDITSDQFRALATLTEKFAGDHARTTVEQNIILRWVREADLPALYEALNKAGLSEPGAGTIVDVTACPGTDTCKLGIASSRGLAGELRERLAVKSMQLDEAVKNLRIKISGCFNSCGQHHVADIGFYGNSRNISNFTVPHFQVLLGGQWSENAASYGLAMGAIPSRRIPEVIDRITGRFVNERSAGESFQAWTKRLGKAALKELLNEFTAVPPRAEDPAFYSDWGDPRQFSIGDMGEGECAGAVVSLAQFGLTSAESQAFQAQLALEAGEFQKADELAYQAMLEAARALVRIEWLDVPNDPEATVNEFKKRFVDTQIFWDRFAQGKFAQYLFLRHESPPTRFTQDAAHHLIEEANLFIDAAHACEAKLSAKAATLLKVQIAMVSHKVVFKLFVDGPPPELGRLVPVFHSWIQKKSIDNHLLIDVASYAHVKDGPGIVLVGHEGNFSMDCGEGRPGLMYQRKQRAGDGLAENLRAGLYSALLACSLLEQDAGLRFSTREIVFRIADRLSAPNTKEVFDQVAPSLVNLLAPLNLGPARLDHHSDPTRMFEVRLHSPNSPTAREILSVVRSPQ